MNVMVIFSHSMFLGSTAPMMPMMMCSMPGPQPPPRSFAPGFNASFLSAIIESSNISTPQAPPRRVFARRGNCSAPRKQLATLAMRKSSPNFSAPPRKKAATKAMRKSTPKLLCDMDEMEMDTESEELEAKEPKIADPLHSIVSLQSFVGSYNLDAAFCKAISKDLDELKKEATTNKWNKSAWATTLALTYFTLNLSDRKDSWELIYNKAKKWLSKNHPNDVDAMFAAAEKIMKKS